MWMHAELTGLEGWGTPCCGGMLGQPLLEKIREVENHVFVESMVIQGTIFYFHDCFGECTVKVTSLCSTKGTTLFLWDASPGAAARRVGLGKTWLLLRPRKS